jgi:dihydrofolate synthase/folylpolyglutamate synthase
MLKKRKKHLDQWLLELETNHNKKIDLGLSRVKKIYDRLELDKVSANIITVAGTNGKGSTVSIISSILKQANYKVGEFTSPHLSRYNERIKINGVEASDDEIISAFEQIEKHLGEITLSYFEYSTLAAAIIFKNQKVDVSIFEVGLGGRLDSVNVIDTDCAVITTVDIDHTAWLGNDKESIGFEKAGIYRSGKPAIYADTDCPLSIKKHAKDIAAKLILLNEKYQFEETQNGFNYKYLDFRYLDLPKPNIRGDWQLKNAATAITALKSLNLIITEDEFRKGLVCIQLDARLQLLSRSPDVYIDVSHNAQAAKSLSNWLHQNPIEGNTIAVFAVLGDKEPINWLHYFNNTINVWCISEVNSERALKTNELLKDLSKYSELILSFDSIKQAYLNAKVVASERDRIIVFGSFYTVSEVLESV